MDAFFASVEQLDNPEWRGKPVIVGGSVESRGVVAAASYEARKFGVHSAMSMWSAKLRCPNAVFTHGRMDRYEEISAKIKKIFLNFTPVVEPISIDEAFLDITGSQRLLGSPLEIAKKIKIDINKETGLVASVGIAPTKFVAKLASDLEKPNGLVIICEDEVTERLAPLSVGKLWGVGKKFEKALSKLGIHTIADARLLPLDYLEQRFGSAGSQLYYLARGVDSRKVEGDVKTKSVSNESTFSEDITDIEEIRKTLMYLSDKVARRLRKGKIVGRVVTLKVKYDDFKVVTRRKTLESPVAISKTIFEIAFQLLLDKTDAGDLPVRLIGVGVSNLMPEDVARQHQLFWQEEIDVAEIIEETTDLICEKMGEGSIQRGIFISDKR